MTTNYPNYEITELADYPEALFFDSFLRQNLRLMRTDAERGVRRQILGKGTSGLSIDQHYVVNVITRREHSKCIFCDEFSWSEVGTIHNGYCSTHRKFVEED